MEYKEFEWSNHKWIARERWGSCHPIKPDWWYDPERVEIDDDGVLHLKTKWNPKSIVGPDGNTYDSKLGVGLISSTEKFGYGEYEIEAKLPSGKGLWETHFAGQSCFLDVGMGILPTRNRRIRSIFRSS